MGTPDDQKEKPISTISELRSWIKPLRDDQRIVVDIELISRGKNKNPGEFKTAYTQVAVCPWCGYESSVSLDDGECECISCGEPFIVVCDTEVLYLTYKA